MRGKLLLVTGVAVGYVLGSKAGRKRYDQIAKASGKVWNSRPVQAQVHRVEDFAKDVAPEVAAFIGGSVKKIAGGSSDSTTTSTAGTRRKPSSRKRTPAAGTSSSSE